MWPAICIQYNMPSIFVNKTHTVLALHSYSNCRAYNIPANCKMRFWQSTFVWKNALSSKVTFILLENLIFKKVLLYYCISFMVHVDVNASVTRNFLSQNFLKLIKVISYYIFIMAPTHGMTAYSLQTFGLCIRL